MAQKKSISNMQPNTDSNNSFYLTVNRQKNHTIRKILPTSGDAVTFSHMARQILARFSRKQQSQCYTGWNRRNEACDLMATEANTATAARYVTIYFCYVLTAEEVERYRLSDDGYNAGFSEDIETSLQNQPIFFDYNEVLNHRRFMPQNSVVMKARVPEAAIIGQHRRLSVKPGYLTENSICDQAC